MNTHCLSVANVFASEMEKNDYLEMCSPPIINMSINYLHDVKNHIASKTANITYEIINLNKNAYGIPIEIWVMRKISLIRSFRFRFVCCCC